MFSSVTVQQFVLSAFIRIWGSLKVLYMLLCSFPLKYQDITT